MQRRKFIAGVGSLAAGGAAVTGTGAFTSVSAERNVAVEVEDDDASAFLGLVAVDDNYAENSGEQADTLTLDIDNINWDATTSIYPIFKVTNNGSRNVAVTISNGSELDDVHLHWFVGETGGQTLDTYDPNSLLNSNGDLDATSDDRILAPGDSMPVGMYVSTGDADAEQENTDTPFDKDATITVEAVSDQELSP